MTDQARTSEEEAGGPLLAEDEPAPFEHINEQGASPLLLLCDHATNFLPRAFKSLGLDQAQLARHIAWDIGAAAVSRHLATLLDAPALLAGYSRLVIDCNRKLGHETSIAATSDGSRSRTCRARATGWQTTSRPTA